MNSWKGAFVQGEEKMKCSNHNDTLSRTQREPKTPRTAVAAAAPAPQRDTERESMLPLVLDGPTQLRDRVYATDKDFV